MARLASSSSAQTNLSLVLEVQTIPVLFLHGLGRLRTVGKAKRTRLLTAEQLEGFVRRSKPARVYRAAIYPQN